MPALRRWPKLSAGRKGILAILSGTAGAQLILLLSSPVLGRLFAPEQFGPFAVANALLIPAAVIMALRFELAIPLPRRDDDARELLALGMRICAFVTVALLATVLLAKSWFASLLGLSPDDANILMWVPLTAGAMGAFVLLNQTAIRLKMYAAIARRNVLQAAGVVFFQLSAGLLGLGAHGLAGGLLLGQLVGVWALLAAVRGELGPSDAAARRSLAREYRRFPLIMAPSGLVNSLGLQAPVLLASSVFGATVAGWLGMTQRVLAMPVALFGVSVAQVFLGEFAEARRHDRGGLRRQFVKTSRTLIAVGALGALVLLAAGPLLFRIFLGEEWEASGEYARALAPALMLQLVASPLSQTLVVMGRLGWQATWDVGRLLLCAGAVLGGAAMGLPPLQTTWLLSGAMVLSYAALWGLSLAAVGES
ncbi:oligosaccharide flippase family protein [Janibacter melonis]|uniref:Oligosaccharide flippase family protein n=1 Tax=Janibacter melonis TaxID=262209 RepID=A0A5P8FPL9_9MICO|nr:oligosaccharide flippase family protein [Janibacter melonis]QFQ30682.2 oligosaccharide flippase family protein [Janibacter melonis]